MAREIKTIFALDGERKYTEAIKQINKEQTLLRAELQATTAAFAESGDEQDILREKGISLEQQITLQKKKIEETRHAVEQASAKYGDAADTTIKYKIQLANAEAGLGKLQTELAKTNKQLLLQESNLKKVGDAAQTAGENVQKAGEKISKTGDTLTNTVTKPVAAAATAALALGANALISASDIDQAMNQFIGATGLGKEAAEEYRDVMQNIYADNYGENFGDIATGMLLVKQQMGDLPVDKMQDTVEAAFLLRDTFDVDLNEGIRGANALMKQFGVDSVTAYNYMVQGAQKGLNQNQDLADQLSEYAPYYADMGLSIDQMFAVMENGARDGAFQIDYINDLMKEFGIRTKDNSDSTKEAFKGLGLDAKELTKAFAEGGEGASEAFTLVTDKLFAMKDEVKQNEIGVALFGTKWEDLGIDAVKALTETNGTIDATQDKLGELAEIKYDDVASEFAAMGREIQMELQPAVKDILPIAREMMREILPDIKRTLPNIVGKIKDVMPVLRNVADGVMDVVEAFTDLSPETQETIIKAGLLVAALGPVVKVTGNMTQGLGKATSAMGKYISKLAERKAAEESAELATSGLSAATKAVGSVAAPAAGVALGTLAVIVGGLALEYRNLNKDVWAAEEAQAEMGEAAVEFAEGMSSYRDGVESATSALDGYNQESTLSTEKMSELEQKIQKTQEKVTGIAKKAAEESREYTQKEREQIEELIGLLAEYSEEKYKAYMAQFDVLETMASQETDMTKERHAELTKAIEEGNAETAALIDADYANRIAKLQELYGKEGELDKKAYKKGLAEAKAERDERLKILEEKTASATQIVTDGYLEQNAAELEGLENIRDLNELRKDLDEEKAEWLDNHIEERKQMLGVAALNELDMQQMQLDADREFAKEEKELWEDMADAFGEASDDNLGALMAMIADAETKGAELESETADMVNGVIDALSVMPEDSKAEIREAWQEMLEQIEKDSPGVVKEAAELPNSMIAAMNDALGLGQSPSKMETVGQQAAEGFRLGLSGKRGEIFNEGVAAGLAFEKGVKSKKGLEIESPSKKMKQVGVYAAEGVVVGAKESEPSVFAEGAALGTSLARGMESAQGYLSQQLAASPLQVQVGGPVTAGSIAPTGGKSGGRVEINITTQQLTQAQIDYIINLADRRLG